MGYFSNGTEGAMYEEQYCSRCIHSDLGEGKEIGVDKPCPVWMAHTLWAYELCNADPEENPGKQMLDMLIPRVPHTFSDGITHSINGECAMFAASGKETE